MFGITIVLVIGVWYFIFQKPLKEECNYIEKVARNEVSVAYLDNWASEHVLNKGYHFVTGMHGDIYGMKGDEFIAIHPLPDEKISGIDRKYFRLSIEKISDDLETEITSKNVGRIEFGRGRNQVIILSNGAHLLSYRGLYQSSAHLLKINESVFVYCADTTF